MVRCTSKLSLACMVCHTQVSLPMSCSRNSSTNMVKDKANSSQACGCMIGSPSGSLLWWTILGSSMSVKRMQYPSRL
ncbi:hypothetical protein ACHAW6_009274 [Cyclotella cf. meneghiniana]